jgi:hypothetical protein
MDRERQGRRGDSSLSAEHDLRGNRFSHVGLDWYRVSLSARMLRAPRAVARHQGADEVAPSPEERQGDMVTRLAAAIGG